MEATLTPRLLAAAQLVRPGTVAADIGTDHAILPIYLVQQGIAVRAYASDLREGPLNRAKINIGKFGVQGSVIPIRCSGLSGIPRDATDIVIAGMGGERITEILADAPWVREDNRRLILQPMTRAAELRAFLWDGGFETKEIFVREENRLYTVLSARYAGAVFAYTEAQLLLGLGTGEDLWPEYARMQLKRQEKILAGLAHSALPDREERIAAAQELMEQLKVLVPPEEKGSGRVGAAL